MDKDRSKYSIRFLLSALVLILAVTLGYAASESTSAEEKLTAVESGEVAVKQPMEIPENVTCGKCGMYPAQYTRWQAQIIFKDGSMTPFDGCKCLYNFLFAMDKFDQNHSRDDVEVAWVKDFDSSTWIKATDAYYVVGSSMMGPMGKELIPFADGAAALKFNQEHGGTVMAYGEITPDVLKTLGMGGMNPQQSSQHMKM